MTSVTARDCTWIKYKKPYQFYQTCKAHDTYKTANIFLLVQSVLNIIRFYYIQGPLRQQKDICDFIEVMGLTCLIKLVRFFIFSICCFYTTSVVLILVSISQFTAFIFDFQNGGRPPSWICYGVIPDHPRFAFDGPNILLKLHIDHVYILCKISPFSCSACLAWPIHTPFGKFLGILSLTEFRYCRNPQKDRPWAKKNMSHNRENRSTGSTWVRD